MDNDIKTVILYMDENLEDFNKELEFSYTDENFSFNISGNKDGQDGARVTYDVTTRECTFDTLDGTDDGVNEEIVATCTEGKSDYIFVTDDYLAIPILESFGINYIVSPSMNLEQHHIDAINDVSVCLTTITGLATEYETIQTAVVFLDLSKLSSDAATSLFDVAVAIQKEKKDGLEAISKHLYTCYKNSTESDSDNNNASTHYGVTVEDEVLPAAQKATNNPISHETQSTLKKHITVINLTELVADSKYQQRVHEDQSAIDDLARAYSEGEEIPPIEVVNTGSKKIIVDGFHRYSGAKAAKVSTIDCHVTDGTEREAFIISLGANAKNKALKRTNADKRKAVMAALSDDEFKELSNRDIAKICAVSHSIVNKIKTEVGICGNVSTLDNRVDDNVADTPIETVVANSSAEYVDKSNTGNISTRKTTVKKLKQSISNKFVSLVISVKELISEEALNDLLVDLNAVINSYESEAKEVN